MNLIVAVTNDYAIGKGNDLLFHLPKDLQYFKEKTINKIVVMGHKTYNSLPKKPLPKRINIVLSSKSNFEGEGVINVHSIEELLKTIKNYNDDDVFICGGASLYNLLMDYCKTAYVTKIDKVVSADTFIDNIEKKGNWEKISESETFRDGNVSYKFEVYKNNKVKK